MMRYSSTERQAIIFVGPSGSSDERAARQFAKNSAADVLMLNSLKSLLSTVDATPGVYGVVPLDDSLHGTFTETINHLIFKTHQAIICETLLLSELLHFQSLHSSATPDVALSHPAILEHFAPWLAEHGIQPEPTPTTKHACEMVRARGNPSIVAIAPDIVSRDCQLVHCAALEAATLLVDTRFGLVGRAQISDWESNGILLFLLPLQDRVGTLAQILNVLRDHQLNLTEIRSIRMAPHYPHGFVIEVSGSLASQITQDALRALVASNVAVKVIGCCELNFTPGIRLTEESVPNLLRDVKKLLGFISGRNVTESGAH